MPLTDDDFVKTGKLEGYSEMIQKLHEEEQTQPEITYDLQLDDDEDEGVGSWHIPGYTYVDYSRWSTLHAEYYILIYYDI